MTTRLRRFIAFVADAGGCWPHGSGLLDDGDLIPEQATDADDEDEEDESTTEAKPEIPRISRRK